MSTETIHAHPTAEQLAGYVAGTLSDGMELLVATHLTYCAKCRAAVRKYEALAGAFMMDEPGVNDVRNPNVERAIEAAMAVEPEADVPVIDARLPRTILRELAAADIGALDWKRRVPGVRECPLPGFGDERVSLLEAHPGYSAPAHTHEGNEATLILTGALDDDGREYRQGDVSLADSDHDHHPRAVGDEPCLCLIVLSGNMRFTGRFGRALNLFAS